MGFTAHLKRQVLRSTHPTEKENNCVIADACNSYYLLELALGALMVIIESM